MVSKQDNRTGNNLLIPRSLQGNVTLSYFCHSNRVFADRVIINRLLLGKAGDYQRTQYQCQKSMESKKQNTTDHDQHADQQ